LPRGIGPWVTAEQDRQQVFGLRDLRLDQRDLHRGGLVLRLDLRDRHLRGLPVLELQLVQAHRFGEGGERAPGDVELLVQTAQRDVIGRHSGDEREDHAAARLVGGEHVRLRRL
jgi:hypothetical protein